MSGIDSLAKELARMYDLLEAAEADNRRLRDMLHIVGCSTRNVDDRGAVVAISRKMWNAIMALEAERAA
jgi:hypothetical protein